VKFLLAYCDRILWRIASCADLATAATGAAFETADYGRDLLLRAIALGAPLLLHTSAFCRLLEVVRFSVQAAGDF